MVLKLSGPPVDIATTVVKSGIPKVCSKCKGSIPYGKSYWALTGKGAGSVDKTSKKKSNKALENDVIVPTDITLKNYTDYTFYDMLGVTESTCDESTLKKAYHKAVLLYHPDKKHNNDDFKNEKGQEDRTVFLKIQEAYNTLGDTKKKRAYDSQLPFNEKSPSEKKVLRAIEKGGEAYYELWRPCFERNARFAEKLPVPDIGDSASPIAEVYAFYDYWVKFESWRDFTGQDAEHDPESASNREEKRWMIKENDRVAKKKKKDEMIRVNDFVMRAMGKDPRIKAEKDRKKNKKANDAKAAEEAAAAKAAEEAAKLAATPKMDKATKDKLKKAQSKGRNIMRKLLRAVAAASGTESQGEYGVISEADLEFVTASASLDELNAMNATLGAEPATKDASLLTPEGIDAFVQILQGLKDGGSKEQDDLVDIETSKVNGKTGSNSRSVAEESSTNAVRVWDKSTLGALSKAVNRFPAGSKHRWDSVANFMNDSVKTPEAAANPFKAEECSKKAHEAVAKMSKNIIDSKVAKEVIDNTTTVKSQDWSQEQQKALEKGLVTYPNGSFPATERWEKIAEMVPDKSAKECLKQFKELCAMLKK